MKYFMIIVSSLHSFNNNNNNHYVPHSFKPVMFKYILLIKINSN